MAFRGLVAMCNLLLSASNVLKNRNLHVDWKEETAHSLPKQHIGVKNSLSARLETAKVNIKTKKYNHLVYGFWQ